MTKNMYIQPSVNITEMEMVQALCVSGGDSGSSTMSSVYSNITTDTQL